MMLVGPGDLLVGCGVAVVWAGTVKQSKKQMLLAMTTRAVAVIASHADLGSAGSSRSHPRVRSMAHEWNAQSLSARLVRGQRDRRVRMGSVRSTDERVWNAGGQKCDHRVIHAGIVAFAHHLDSEGGEGLRRRLLVLMLRMRMKMLMTKSRVGWLSRVHQWVSSYFWGRPEGRPCVCGLVRCLARGERAQTCAWHCEISRDRGLASLQKSCEIEES